MRDWTGIRETHDQLAHRSNAESARKRLVAFAGQDHGTDERAWREVLRVLLRQDTAAALDEMGVLDAHVQAWMQAEPFAFNSLRLDHEIRHTVMNAHVRIIWLPEDLEHYGGEADQRDLLSFVYNAARTTGARVTARPADGGIEIALDDQRTTLTGEGRALREQAFAALVRWAGAHGHGRRFVLDEGWHAWLVTDAQLAAVRRHRPVTLRAFDAARTAAAAAFLAEVGLELPPAQDLPDGAVAEIVIAWLFAAHCGVTVDSFNAHVIWRALGALGVRELPAQPPEDLEDDEYPTSEIVDAANALLANAKSAMRLVGVERDEHALVLAVPIDRIEPLANANILAHGMNAALPATRTVALFRPAVIIPITPSSIVPESRQWIGDGESVDSATDYHYVVEELCAIAELAPPGFSCTESRGVRTLSLALGTRRFEATLQGNTDWIDAPPLIACMNELAQAAGKTERFYEFRDPRWGQELGIVFATTAEANRLREHGYLVEDH